MSLFYHTLFFTFFFGFLTKMYFMSTNKTLDDVLIEIQGRCLEWLTSISVQAWKSLVWVEQDTSFFHVNIWWIVFTYLSGHLFIYQRISSSSSIQLYTFTFIWTSFWGDLIFLKRSLIWLFFTMAKLTFMNIGHFHFIPQFNKNL